MKPVLTTIEQPVYQQDLMRARALFRQADANYKDGCEYLLKAQAAGASQREMAIAIGRSQTTVNRYLKWHADGCDPAGPFASDHERHNKNRLAANHSHDREEDDDPDAAGSDDQFHKDLAKDLAEAEKLIRAKKKEKARRNIADPDAVKARKPSKRAELFTWLVNELAECLSVEDAGAAFDRAVENGAVTRQTINQVIHFLSSVKRQ
jgi:hypothetical protein